MRNDTVVARTATRLPPSENENKLMQSVTALASTPDTRPTTEAELHEIDTV